MDDPTDSNVTPKPERRFKKARVCPSRDAGERDMTKLPLTPRELQVLKLIMQGLMNKEIAAQLVVSERTVWFHCTNIYAKLAVQSRTQAAMRGYDMGLRPTLYGL